MNEERITMAINLLKEGIAEDEVVKRLRLTHKVKVKDAAAILKETMERSRTVSAQETSEPEAVKEEESQEVAITETASITEEVKEELSEVEKAKQWVGEGNDMPCSVYGEQDLSDPGCEACKRDCPVTFVFCSVLSSKPKTVKKVVVASSNGTTTTTRKKGAGFEKVKFIEGLIAEGTHTAKEILAIAQNQYPEIKEITLRTYITDSKNIKYFAKHGFNQQTVVTDGKLHY